MGEIIGIRVVSPRESVRPYSRSPSFINSALKNEIWKIPLPQIFVFWMCKACSWVLYFCLPHN
jgi:hypothetical protein